MPCDPRACSPTWVGRPLDPIVSVCLRSLSDVLSKANTDTTEPQGAALGEEIGRIKELGAISET